MNPVPSDYLTIKVIGFNELSKKVCLALPAGRQAAGRKVGE